MTTTPLPPFPRPSVFDPGRFGVAYSQAQMVDFATAARADLEAENERLRDALEFVARHKSSDWPERCQQMVDTARAVLKEQP